MTYFVGLQGSVAKTRIAGASYGGSALLATDPQGNQGIVVSAGFAGTIGTPGYSGGIQIGAATYQNIQGFLGPSYGAEASGGLVLNVGGGYSTNSSGVATYANIGIAAGKNIDVSPETLSNGLYILPFCSE